MSRRPLRWIAVAAAFMLVAAACGDSDDSSGESNGGSSGAVDETVDYESIGLWDDGPCDESLPELTVGLMTVFESPVLSLKDTADALEASADAFNSRGGANGSCIRVMPCDDGANLDKALECVRELDEAGVVATINDQVSVAQDEVSEGMVAAGIPRVATNVVPQDWGAPNVYPLDASGTGVVMLMPDALIQRDIDTIGIIRVDLAPSAAMVGVLQGIYEHDGVTLPFDAPVPGGTTDYSQFILGPQEAGVGGVILALGEQETVQILRSAEQLSTDMSIASSLGSFSRESAAPFAGLGDQVVYVWAFPPATYDLPAYAALRQDLAASGSADLQPDSVRTASLRSWIGLYALIKMIRDADMTDFTREGITEMLDNAKDVPMLDIFGGENWTPALERDGAWKRAGINNWSSWTWDPDAEWNGEKGNFVKGDDINFDAVLCGSPIGAPEPC